MIRTNTAREAVPKLRVFVSSVQKELGLERAAIPPEAPRGYELLAHLL